MTSHKKPKYKLDPKKFMAEEGRVKEKEKDLSGSEIYQEMLRSKSRRRY